MRHTLQRSQAWPVRVDDCRRFLTELEKDSGFCSGLGSFAGVPAGEPVAGRFGGIGGGAGCGAEDAVLRLLWMEEAVWDGDEDSDDGW